MATTVWIKSSNQHCGKRIRGSESLLVAYETLGEGRRSGLTTQYGSIDTPKDNSLTVTVCSFILSILHRLIYQDDESNVLVLPAEPKPIPVKTTWTLLLYLTSSAEGCQGGETVFYPDDLPGKKPSVDKEIAIGLETGMALLHKHGNDCMLVCPFQTSL